MLKVNNLNTYYGAIQALYDVSIEVPDGKIVSIIGANGAGKTSLLKSITGVVDRHGEIVFDGEDLSKAKAQKVNKAGIIQVPEGRLTFPGLSVSENLEVGTISWHGMLGTGKYDNDMKEVYDLFPRLLERKDQLAWSLSGGEQQMLAIGRGMMGRPKLLMLDEPSMGLAPLVVKELFEKIVEINKRGISILLIEQNAKLSMQVADYVYVLEHGKITMQGPADQMRNDPRIKEAYLGKK